MANLPPAPEIANDLFPTQSAGHTVKNRHAGRLTPPPFLSSRGPLEEELSLSLSGGCFEAQPSEQGPKANCHGRWHLTTRNESQMASWALAS